jgi:hypothetical protein
MDLSSDTHQSRARDWGARWIPIPEVGFEPDVGFHLGGGARYTAYGFRHFPYRSRLEVAAALGTNTGRPRASLTWDLPLVRERLRADIALAYEGAEVPRFHGFGNETTADRPAAFYEDPGPRSARRGVLLPRRGGRPRRAVALMVQRIRTAGRSSVFAPYGHSDFARLALTGALAWEGQDDAAPRWSGRLALAGYLAPAWLDVDGAAGASPSRHRAGRARKPSASGDRRVRVERISGRYPYSTRHARRSADPARIPVPPIRRRRVTVRRRRSPNLPHRVRLPASQRLRPADAVRRGALFQANELRRLAFGLGRGRGRPSGHVLHQPDLGSRIGGACGTSGRRSLLTK